MLENNKSFPYHCLIHPILAEFITRRSFLFHNVSRKHLFSLHKNYPHVFQMQCNPTVWYNTYTHVMEFSCWKTTVSS